MKERLKNLLKKYPRLYSAIMKGYTFAVMKSRYLKEYLFGTRVREREWARRHLYKGNDWNNTQHLGENDEWVKSYWESRYHNHRSFLVERISNFSPISSLLEIGCNCGPNLYLLAKRFPDAEIRGIDINPSAVQKGNEWLAQEGISNVKLLVGKADELGQFQDRSFDVVFTDAVLIYIGPDKIKKVVQDMIRITRQGLILIEWHCFEPQRKDRNGLGVYYEGCWKRDYVALLRQFISEEQINIIKINEDMWPDKNWKQVGAIIEAKLFKKQF